MLLLASSLKSIATVAPKYVDHLPESGASPPQSPSWHTCVSAVLLLLLLDSSPRPSPHSTGLHSLQVISDKASHHICVLLVARPTDWVKEICDCSRSLLSERSWKAKLEFHRLCGFCRSGELHLDWDGLNDEWKKCCSSLQLDLRGLKFCD